MALILTKSISRFSRNSLDCLEKIRMLKNLPRPVYVYFEKECIHTKDEKSDLMIAIFGSIAQEESINAGEAMSWGKRRYAERGIVNPSVVPYGYRAGENGKWEIVEEEATVIRGIYQDTIDGQSYNEITKALNFNGVITSRGNGQWWIQTVTNILSSELYRGNYLYQKTYTKDTLSDKTARNDGVLPQYLIENRHEAIVSNDDWERVQEILGERSEKFANRKKMKYPKDQRKNKSFEGILNCGACESPVGHRRFIQCSTETHVWLCNKADKAYRTDKCGSLRLNQKYIELNFMKTLQDIKHSRIFKSKVIKHINSLKLSPEEKTDKSHINSQMDSLNQTLYKVVDQELNKNGQDSKKVDELTEQIVVLQSKLKEYTVREVNVEQLNEELSWFMKAINSVDEGRINSTEGLDPEKRMYFDDVIFKRVVKEASLNKGGRIVYQLHLGIEWTIDYSYEEFQVLLNTWKDNVRKAKKLDFLNGPDVQAMLEYCKESKKYGELHSFMNERKEISYSYFRRSVIRPLMKMGRLKNTITEDSDNRYQKYISE